MGFNTLQNTLLLKRQSEAAKVSIEFEKKKDEFNKRIQKCKEEEERIKDKEIMVRFSITLRFLLMTCDTK